MSINTISKVKNLYSFIQDELDLEPVKHEVADLLDAMEREEDDLDYYWEVGKQEWRVIHVNAIDEIAEEEIKDLVQEVYLHQADLSKLWWIAIDWQETAENVINADGYGHHFGRYDGHEYEFNNYYFFRTN
jgi:hypothetical protein